MLSSSLPPGRLQRWLLRNPSTNSSSTAAGSTSNGEGECGGRKPGGSAGFFSQFAVFISRIGCYAEVDSCLVSSWGPFAFWFAFYSGIWLGDGASKIKVYWLRIVDEFW